MTDAEPAFTYKNEYGTVGSYAMEVGERRDGIKRYMLLQYTNWIISDVDFENHIRTVLPPWATYFWKQDGTSGLGPKYVVFVDFKTTNVSIICLTWNSMFGPAKSKANLEVFAVRGRYFGESSKEYLEIFREFVNRAAGLAREISNSPDTGQSIEPYDNVQGGTSRGVSRGQWVKWE
jgi:hypothetical protein